MWKYIPLMVLLLFFQPGGSQAQDPGNSGGIPVAAAKPTGTVQVLFSDSVRHHLGFQDSLPGRPTVDPSRLQHLRGTGDAAKRLFPEALKASRPSPVGIGIPAGLFQTGGSGTGHLIPMIPTAENTGSLGKGTVPGLGIPHGLKEKLKTPDPAGFKAPDISGQGRPSGTVPGMLKGPAGMDADFLSAGPFRLLPGKVVPDTVLHAMDSAGKAIAGRKDLLQREEQLGEGLKKVAFSNKPKFWDRTYLEGIVGLDPNAARIQNISPALGYYLNPKMSLGLGPSINLGNPKELLLSAVGSRSFFKYELLPRKAYLQAEDLAHANRAKNAGGEKPGPGKIDHSLFVGAGYLMSISNALSLNALVLYNVNQSLQSNQQTSPFNIRLGMSSFKPRE